MRSATTIGAAVLVALGILYPAIVYWARDVLPPLSFVALALVLVAVRVARLAASAVQLWRLPLIGAGLVIAGAAAFDGWLAAKAYPVVLSLAASLAFGLSLVQPPSLYERFARMREPELPPGGARYCRIVTVVWTVWLVANAVVAAGLAVIGSEEAWALWTGLVAYIVMGMLLGGEFLVRQRVRPRLVSA